MHTVTTIGLVIAKSVFQVHGVDAAGQAVIRGKLKRRCSGVSRSCRLEAEPSPIITRPFGS
jgi:tRNA/tmRNA/rRNA uracil-C5-methylase (TrmA/RlmC/RlmD family)